MLNTPVTATKIQPPRLRANLIVRGPLEQRLGQAFASHRLVLLSAPAGFGKTAALTRQLALLPDTTGRAWIAADADDDLHRFLVCLLAALEPFDLPWRAAPDAMIAAAVGARGERRTIVTSLVNALAASDLERGLIVIDDAHRIADPAVFELIDLLLERLPDRWAFVISSRVDPPLALARLRTQDELAEFRQADLRFGHQEVAALLAANERDVDPGQLLRRTGGWAAGLRLALNAVGEGMAPQGDSRKIDRDVFEYLAAEVLEQMPAELRDFLLPCSVLSELTVTRCTALTGNPRSAQHLDEVERRGLFVSVSEGSESALTLHDLFRDCLQERLRREQPDAVPELLRRAAATEPDPIRRLSFLLRTDAWDEAERVFEEAAAELIAAGAIEPVLRLLDQFPKARQAVSPTLALVRGQVAWAQWDWETMAAAVRQARVGFTHAGDERRRLRAQVYEIVALDGSGMIAESKQRLAQLQLESAELETRALALALTTWHELDSGNFRAVAVHYSAVVDILEQSDRLELWYRCFQRPLYVWLPGMRTPLTAFVNGVMRRTGDTPSLMRAIAYVMAAWLALWRGELDQARERVIQAQDDARWLGSPTRLLMFVGTVRAAVHAARAEHGEAMDVIDTFLGYFGSQRSSGSPTSMLAHYLLYAIRLADALDDAAAVRRFAERMPLPAEITNFSMLRAPLRTLTARLAAIERRYEDACAAWAQALADEAAIDVFGLAEDARLHHACALLALGRVGEAARMLRPALRTLAESGELGAIALAGRRVLTMLAAAPWGNELDWTELATLRAWARRFAGAEPEPLPLGPAVAGLLTARELQVLARIAAGDSNKLIARAYALSPHTVKRHVAHILDKLGVSSRSEAAQWYRART